MKIKRASFLHMFLRQMTAVLLSALLIPAAVWDLQAQDAPAGAYTPLEAVALDQLVAPIALYPDSLVAQILTAATYPDQVAQADAWSQQNAGLPPEQRAMLADGMMWDPSVKALTAFPSVLDNLAKNSNWTSQLGNAYYNQPSDIMNAVQAMRYQAQQAGALKTTAQQRVYDDNGSIAIAPVDPNIVYVPYYDPWRLWGPTIGFAAYPGYYMFPPPRGIVLGLGIGFGVGIGIGLWGHYGWGWGHWGPNWRGGGVFFNHGAYFSHSVTVFNHGHWGGYNRGVFEHGGRGVPGGFHASATVRGGGGFAGRPGGGAVGRPGGAVAGRPGGAAGRPGGAVAGRPGGAVAGRPGGAAAGRPGGAAGRPGGAAAGRPGGAAAGRPGGAAAGRTGGARAGGAGGHAGGGGGHKK